MQKCIYKLITDITVPFINTVVLIMLYMESPGLLWLYVNLQWIQMYVLMTNPLSSMHKDWCDLSFLLQVDGTLSKELLKYKLPYRLTNITLMGPRMRQISPTALQVCNLCNFLVLFVFRFVAF